MYRIWKILLMASLYLFSFVLYAKNNSDQITFDQLFSEWTAAFNNKDLIKSCALFSKSVTASYRGIPIKNYTNICDGFNKIFHENKSYHYKFKLHDIYQCYNLAVVRISWYLQVYDQGKLIEQTQDEGMDVLKRNEQDQWKIINYIAYSVN